MVASLLLWTPVINLVWRVSASRRAGAQTLSSWSANECRWRMTVPKTECSKPCGGGHQVLTVPHEMMSACREMGVFEMVHSCNSEICFEDVKKTQRPYPRLWESGKLASFRAGLALSLHQDVAHECTLTVSNHNGEPRFSVPLRLSADGASVTVSPEDLHRAYVDIDDRFSWAGCELQPLSRHLADYNHERARLRRKASTTRTINVDGLRFNYTFKLEAAPPTAEVQVAVLRPNAVRISFSVLEHGSQASNLKATLTSQTYQAQETPSFWAAKVEFANLQPKEIYDFSLRMDSDAGTGHANLRFQTPGAGCGPFYKCCQGKQDTFIHKCVYKSLWGGRCSKEELNMTTASNPSSCAYE